MKFTIMFVISCMAFAIGCANNKTKEGRTIKVTREDNVISCRFIGNVSGSDAMEQAAARDRATHLVWTGKDEGKVYSCD